MLTSISVITPISTEARRSVIGFPLCDVNEGAKTERWSLPPHSKKPLCASVEKIQAIILYMFFSYIADSLYHRKAVNSRKSGISQQLIQHPFVLCFQICVMQRRLNNVAGCITITNTCCVLFKTEIPRNSCVW